MQYRITITNNQTQEKRIITANFSDFEYDSLLNFKNYTQDLLEANFLRKNYDFSVTMGAATTYRAKELPTKEELAYFLHKFRPFGLNDETTNFFRVCNIIKKGFVDDWARLDIDDQKTLFQGGQGISELIQIKSKDTILNSEEMLNKWLYGYEYHKDKEKREYIEKLHDDFFPLELNKIIFYSMLKDKARAIRYISHIISKMKRKYNNEEVHSFIKNIPKGKISTASIIAKALGFEPKNYQRCIGREVCKCDAPERFRVVLKSGWKFPHPDDSEDCNDRADMLRKEGIEISEDNMYVVNGENYLYPNN